MSLVPLITATQQIPNIMMMCTQRAQHIPTTRCGPSAPCIARHALHAMHCTPCIARHAKQYLDPARYALGKVR